MKKILLPLLLITMWSNLFSQNKLTIFSEIGEQFYVILNGIRQNEYPETNVQVDGLTADYYSAKIIFNNADIPDIDKKFLNVTNVDCKPCAVTYKIKYDKKGAVIMRMFNFTPLEQAPVNSNITVVNYNTTPMPAPVVGFQVTETTTTHTNNGDNVNVGMNVGGFNMNVNINDGFGNTNTTTTTTTTTTTVIPTEVVVEETCPAMSFTDFNNLVNTLDAKSWDDDKMAIAKQASNSNCLTAKQIKKVMSLFEWEDAKLEYAKYAYASCYDQNNYYLVNDEFEWSDNVNRLNEYINK